jgi:hypothetical protein
LLEEHPALLRDPPGNAAEAAWRNEFLRHLSS